MKRRASSLTFLNNLRPVKQAQKARKERKPKGLWGSDLYFKTFPDDEAYTLLYEILLERGWKFLGKPYRGTDHKALTKVVAKPQPK